MNAFHLVTLILVFSTFQCSSSKSLSEGEISKLSIALRHLIAGDNINENAFNISLRADGTKEYAVTIRSKNAEELKSLGISVTSVFGDVIVARMTIEELKRVITLQSVRAVEVGSRNAIQQNKN